MLSALDKDITEKDEKTHDREGFDRYGLTA